MNTTAETVAAVDAAIRSRHSIRAFLPTPVPRKTLEDLLAVEGISYLMKDFDKNWSIEANRAFLLEITGKIECWDPQEGDPPHYETCGDCDRCCGGAPEQCTQKYAILTEPCGKCGFCAARSLLTELGKEDHD